MLRYRTFGGSLFFLLLFAALCFPVSPVRASCLDKLPLAPLNLLFWSPAEQQCGYKHMDRLWPHIQSIKKGVGSVSLPKEAAWDIKGTDVFMQRNYVHGLLVLHNGKIVLEKYRGGFTQEAKWTSFSMAKSLTSLLVGCALRDGFITSLDDPVVKYIPELQNSAYSQVTVRQVLTMTSGVAWNENYRDPQSDVARLADVASLSRSEFLGFMGDRKKMAQPGNVFNYSTGEAGLLGYLIRSATGKGPSAYFSEKIWSRIGMEQDAFWIANTEGYEINGCCFSACLRDYGRIGLLLLADGKIQGESVFPAGWMRLATTASPASVRAGRPYGYQFWVRDEGAYQASGIFGQLLHVDPKRKLVIVMLSTWPQATGSRELYADRVAFMRQLKEKAQRKAMQHGQ